MTEREIRNLLRKYIKEDITSEEKDRFLNLVTSPENENAFKEVFLSLLEDTDEKDISTGKTDFNRIYNKILSELNLRKESRLWGKTSFFRSRTAGIVVQSVGVAAVLAITFFLGSIFSNIKNNNAGNQASGIAFTEIKSPYGSTSEINLPDGSQVLLNAGSSIKYQNDFNIENRDLFLSGEAYFKVSKNIDLPLNVSTGDINIKAIGTQFNIKAYGDEPVVETTLVEGKVEITQVGRTGNEKENKFIDLNPNQKAIFIKGTETFTLEEIKKNDTTVTVPPETLMDNILISPKVDIDQVAAWTKGKLVIKGENLEALCIKLQRKYDVTFIFGDDEIKHFRFTGILLDETLDQVLNAVKLTAPIEYTISGKNVFMITNTKEWNNFSKHLK